VDADRTVNEDSMNACARCRRCLGAALVALAVAVGGCATPGAPGGQSPAAPLPRDTEPPPPNVNLSGFPLPYRQGYADGCASASGPERKDAARFASDGNYRTGWQDGRVMCVRN
jgi:hypothetical protein